MKAPKTKSNKSAKKTVRKTAKPVQKRDKQPFRAGLKAFFHPEVTDSLDLRAEAIAMQQQSHDSEDDRKAYQLARAPLERRHAHDGSRTRRSQGAQIKK